MKKMNNYIFVKGEQNSDENEMLPNDVFGQFIFPAKMFENRNRRILVLVSDCLGRNLKKLHIETNEPPPPSPQPLPLES